MASESLAMRDDNGQPVIIGRTQTGALGINVRHGMTSILAVFSGERLTAFAEAIDRAAMPGQRGGDGEAGTAGAVP